MPEMAALLAEEVPQARRRNMPYFVAWLYVKFFPRYSSLKENWGKRGHYSSAKAVAELGLEFTPLKESLVDTATSLFRLGLVTQQGGAGDGGKDL